jgi:hypothetical protein
LQQQLFAIQRSRINIYNSENIIKKLLQKIENDSKLNVFEKQKIKLFLKEFNMKKICFKNNDEIVKEIMTYGII